MACGIYGKLPAKRDFVARGAPRSFLDTWEPWLHGGISASRLELGSAWEDHYFAAPAWRFWLGQDICGVTVTGSFAPSYDGVGRFFPLTIFALPSDGQVFLPPPLNPQDGWYGEAENWLYAARSQEADFEAMSRRLDDIAPPATVQLPKAWPPVSRLGPNTVLIDASDWEMSEALVAIGVEARERAYRNRSIFWTVGGHTVGQSLIVANRMLDPMRFTGLLTGEFRMAE